MNNLVVFIPARSGSKSIKDKNIKELGGKPLIAWSIEIALDCGLRTIVNTDNRKYALIAKKYGAETMIRPKKLAKNNTSMYELLKNEIPKIQPLPELVLLLQPTTPFRDKNEIKKAIEIMNKYKPTCLISVEKVPEKYNPAQIIINTELGLKMADSRDVSERITERQDFPEAFIPTGEIYILKVSNLQKGNIYGDNVLFLETESSININNMDDWNLAENYLKKDGK